jgi:tripartite-type tricarboxylate transporter receptor subunit TctC
VPLVKGGQLRALAVTGAKRLAELPDVPSMAEAGFPDENIGLWSGLFAPAATPPAITEKLETELRRAIRSPEVGDKLRALAVEPSGIPSDELRRLIEVDTNLTADVVKAANLTFEE